MRVAILSDTHGEVDPRILERIAGCDLAVHGGDIGSARVLDAIAPLVGRVLAVTGNNDLPYKWPSGERERLAAIPGEVRQALPGGLLVVIHGHQTQARDRHRPIDASELDALSVGPASVDPPAVPGAHPDIPIDQLDPIIEQPEHELPHDDQSDYAAIVPVEGIVGGMFGPDENHEDEIVSPEHVHDHGPPTTDTDHQDNPTLPEERGATEVATPGATEELTLGAHDDDPAVETPGAEHETLQPPEPRYNLRPRDGIPSTGAFRDAVDNPDSGQSYFPAHTLTQAGRQLLTKDIVQQLYDGSGQVTHGMTLTQMSAKAGLRKHGQRAEQALLKEYAQLEKQKVYESINPETLTSQQRKQVLRAVSLIKEKRDGILKGRTCADGRIQRSLYDKAATSSPTLSSDALMLTILIDAHEGRDVATADITGAYLNAEMDDFVVMKFEGREVDILCQLNPTHRQHVVMENGKPTLYVRLLKALYGCVRSALLWYVLFSGTLKKQGYVLNPYDPCVANKIIEGKQCTIAWYFFEFCTNQSCLFIA